MPGKIKNFLLKQELTYCGDSEYTVFLTDYSDRIIGTGSLSGNVLKYIAIDDDFQGEGIAAAIVSALLKYAYMQGKKTLFLFTKPKNEFLFQNLGFFTMAKTESSVYMENSRNGLEKYLSSLKKGTGVQGAITANCNPFTLGHQYLFEYAAAHCDTLHGFIVSENRSEFPFDVRFKLAKSGTSHIKNLILHESGEYMLSFSTFPTYFMKKTADASRINAELDLTLFYSRIAPALGITKRFVGTEPYCPVTRAYNESMKAILPAHGIEVVEIERKNGISASLVREAIENKDIETVRKLVPESTFKYIAENYFKGIL